MRGGEYTVQYGWQVCFYFGVGESQDSETMSRKDLTALRIVFLLVFVNAAVNLHHKFRPMTEKVSNKTVNHLLSAEVLAAETTGPQPLPQKPFAWRHLATHLARKLLFLRRMAARNNKISIHDLSSLP